jgi:hypothetical protein
MRETRQPWSIDIAPTPSACERGTFHEVPESPLHGGLLDDAHNASRRRGEYRLRFDGQVPGIPRPFNRDPGAPVPAAMKLFKVCRSPWKACSGRTRGAGLTTEASLGDFPCPPASRWGPVARAITTLTLLMRLPVAPFPLPGEQRGVSRNSEQLVSSDAPDYSASCRRGAPGNSCGRLRRDARFCKILAMIRFRTRKSRVRRAESWCTEGDGPGRCERGIGDTTGERAFREKGTALYLICAIAR